MTDPVTFSAILYGRGCIKRDADGGGDIRLTLPDTEHLALAKMMVIPSSVILRVTINIEGGGHEDAISL